MAGQEVFLGATWFCPCGVKAPSDHPTLPPPGWTDEPERVWCPSCLKTRSSAILDTTRTYRYRLDRVVGDGDRKCLFVMLNPSTADESQDDPTIRRCIGFARREGCGHLIVCNLYALRATDPRALRTAEDPMGPENARYLREAAKDADLVIIAWGSNHLGGAWPHRVRHELAQEGPVYALRLTKNRDPGHPLYIPADALLLHVAGRNADETTPERGA